MAAGGLEMDGYEMILAACKILIFDMREVYSLSV